MQHDYRVHCFMIDGGVHLNVLVSPAQPARDKVGLQPITSGDVAAVAQFLHRELNHRITAEVWASSITPSWRTSSPNHGFMLVNGGKVVGVQLAFYSERRIGGHAERFCNIAAWCVAEPYRSHGFRLLRALLSQDAYTFTDLSPTGNVVPLNRLLKFQHLDTTTALVVNFPCLGWKSGIRIVSDPSRIEPLLSRGDLQIFRDHLEAPAAHHLVIHRGDQACYVMFRRERRKRMRLFATLLYVSNPALLRPTLRHLCSHLLTRFGIAATLLEHRVLGFKPDNAINVSSPRIRMFRSSRLAADQIDYLYSELVGVPW